MYNDLIVRHARPGDHDRIADLWFESWFSTGLAQASDASRDELRERLEEEADWDLFVAESQGRICGMLALKQSSSKLDQIFVDPEMKGRGIGRILMREAKKQCPRGMWLKAHRQNLDALRFYRSSGFFPDLDRSRGSSAPTDVFLKWLPSS